MEMFNKYKSPLGYAINDNNTDTYGVDHSGFTIRDELAYQMARQQRENQIIQNFHNQGITKDYPQQGTDFWGSLPDNNFGFGSSQISSNIENMQSQGINSALYPKPISKDSTSYELAQNNTTANTASDINSSNIDYSFYGDGFTKDFIYEMLNDKEYQRALKEYAIPNEGGYVNDPQDPGGETNMGISKRYHPDEDIKNLTRERANALLFKEIWNWNGINTLPSEIKGFVFDHGIRTSPQNAIETTHKALGINPVGDIIGRDTLSRLENMDYNEFLHKYKELVKEQDKQRSGYGNFGKGWDNRTNGYHISN